MLINAQEIFLPSPPGSAPRRLSVDPLRTGAAGTGGAPTEPPFPPQRKPHTQRCSAGASSRKSPETRSPHQSPGHPTVAATSAHRMVCVIPGPAHPHTEEARGKAAEPATGGTNCPRGREAAGPRDGNGEADAKAEALAFPLSELGTTLRWEHRVFRGLSCDPSPARQTGERLHGSSSAGRCR